MWANKKAALRGGGQRTIVHERVYPPLGDDAIANAAIELEAKRDRAELDLVGAVLADHSRLVRVAAGAGIRRRHFSQDDLSLIYLAMAAAYDRDLLVVLRLARAALREAHYWDPTQIAANVGSSLWSDASLAALADSWFASVPVVEHFAKALIALNERQCKAEAAYARCLGELRGEAQSSSGAFEGRAA